MSNSPIHLVLKGDDLEDACISLEQAIQGSYYYSGCSYDGDVCFTIYTSSLQTIEEWMETSKKTGMVRSAEIMDW
jgi:hypothetical protein